MLQESLLKNTRLSVGVWSAYIRQRFLKQTTAHKALNSSGKGSSVLSRCFLTKYIKLWCLFRLSYPSVGEIFANSHMFCTITKLRERIGVGFSLKKNSNKRKTSVSKQIKKINYQKKWRRI